MSFRASPRLSAVVVLATPPFWLASARTGAVRDIGCASAGWQDTGVRSSTLTIGVLSAGPSGTRVRDASATPADGHRVASVPVLEVAARPGAARDAADRPRPPP